MRYAISEVLLYLNFSTPVPRCQLLQCVRTTPESIFGDVLDLDVQAAIHLDNDRIQREGNSVVQSESSDGLIVGAIWVIGEM